MVLNRIFIQHRAASLGLACAIAAQSCAYNNIGIPGFFVSKEIESDVGLLRSVQALGLYMYTTPDVGIVVGRTQREMFYPIETDSSDMELCLTNSQLMIDELQVNGKAYSNRPIFVRTNTTGGLVELRKFALRAQFGINSRQELRVPYDQHSIFYVNTNVDTETRDICGMIINHKQE